MDEEGAFIYNFKKMNQSLEQYIVFMNKTCLFDLLANRGVTNIIDFVLGVETGLDSNGRKNRGGHLMEDLIEGYLKSEGVEYYKEMYLKDVEEKCGVNLSYLSNNGKSAKRFDFVVKTNKLKHNNYPVIGKNGICKGLIRITEINEKKRKKVILVDHNESSQSVEGL